LILVQFIQIKPICFGATYSVYKKNYSYQNNYIYSSDEALIGSVKN